MKKINKLELYKIIILIGYTIVFSILVSSKEIYLIIHPRIVPFFIASIILMLLIIIFSLQDVFSNNRVYKGKEKLGVFLLLLVFILFIIKLGIPKILSKITKENTNSINIEEKGRELLLGEKINVDENNFLDFLLKLEEQEDSLKNKEIEIIGFVLNNEDSSFAICRNVMTCCAADMVTVGVKCRGYETFEDNSWVKVKGRLQEERGESFILITSIEKIEAPKNQYIYPY